MVASEASSIRERLGKFEALKKEYLGIASQYFDIQDTMCNEVFKYSEVTFHLILFPVKDKAKIVDSFCKKVKTFRS